MLTFFPDIMAILTSFAIATLICVLVGMKLRKSGIEHYSSRILLLSAIINTVICSILLLLMGVLGFRLIFKANQFGLIHFIATASLFIVPARSLWNGLTMPKRVKKRFALQPIESKELQDEIGSLASIMQIPRPVVLLSSSFNMPFVFGRSSKSAILAIPANWSALDRTDRHVMLCHELAHIRNKDVGILTWAFAFLTDLKWLLVLIPFITVMSFFAKVEYLAATNILYMGFLIILWLLTKSVVRKRELLADLTVTMLIESYKISNAIRGQRRDLVTGLHATAGKSTGLRITDNIRSWLEDKALFAKKKVSWKMALKLFKVFYSSYPSVPIRMKTINVRHHASSQSSVQLSVSFWAGVSIGLLGILMSMGVFWWGRFVLKLQDNEEFGKMSFRFLKVTGPFAIGFVALLFVLPGWSSNKAIIPTTRRLISLLVRYVMGFLGASAVSCLILVGGWSNIGVKALLVSNILWIIVVLFLGFAANLSMMLLWLEIRYWPRYLFTDILWAIYSLGPALAIIFSSVAIGFVLLLKNSVFVGANIVASVLLGLVIFVLISGDSSISGTEQYLIICIRRWIYRLEGKRFKILSPPLYSAHLIILCSIPAFILFTIIYLRTYHLGKNISVLLALLALGMLCYTLLIFMSRLRPKSISEGRRHKICVLFESLCLIGKFISDHSRDIIEKIIDVYAGENGKNSRVESMFLTTEKIFELTKLIPPEEAAESNMFEQALKWVRKCETEGGFGLWPGCTARLCSTYHSLCILQRAGWLSNCKSDKHIKWLKNLQLPAGYFQGPYSKRYKWEDTFFATASLKTLGANWNIDKKEFCRNWAQKKLVCEGIGKGRLATVYYCLAIIDTLDILDIEIIERTSSWLSTQIEQLLLTNISHNSENVHFAVRTFDILRKHSKRHFSKEQLGLLGNRIEDALSAELAGLHV